MQKASLILNFNKKNYLGKKIGKLNIYSIHDFLRSDSTSINILKKKSNDGSKTIVLKTS